MLIYTHCWELMNSVGSHGSSSLPFVMKVMVCHFVSDSHEVMTALIVVLPLIVVVEISLQLHRSLILINLRGLAQTIPGMEKFGAEANAPLQGLPQMVRTLLLGEFLTFSISLSVVGWHGVFALKLKCGFVKETGRS